MSNSENLIRRIDELIAEEEAESGLLDFMGDYRTGYDGETYAGAYDFKEGNPPEIGVIARGLTDL